MKWLPPVAVTEASGLIFKVSVAGKGHLDSGGDLVWFETGLPCATLYGSRA
jgi:hypothetical protein